MDAVPLALACEERNTLGQMSSPRLTEEEWNPLERIVVTCDQSTETLFSQTLHVWNIYRHIPTLTIKTTPLIGQYACSMECLGIEHCS